MDDCVFCKIVRGEIAAEKIYENKDVFVFLDVSPVNYGHILVIPKKHYKMITDTPDVVLSKVFVKSKEIIKVMKKALKCDFVAVSVVGVEVPHFHVHLVPRYFDDGLAQFWPSKEYSSEKEVKKMGDKIRKCL